jgi:hypothetical protein
MKSGPSLQTNLLPVRSPVRRLYADRYLLITLLSFAASVTLTRLFLNLTGFPQLGGGGLHIAHVLWGGLLLFAAVLFPLILANRWALDVSAFLSGVGVGIFIDEVGKFITQQNDYFFPAAAPIIYALFLITLLIYTLVRRKREEDPRRNIYLVLEQLEDVIDRDLSELEKSEIIHRLKEIKKQSQEPALTSLANSLTRYLHSKKIAVVAERLVWWQKIERDWLNFENSKFARPTHRFFIVIGIFLWGAWAIAHSLLSWYLSLNKMPLSGLASELINNHLPLSSSGIGLVEMRFGMEILAGAVLLAACFLFIIRKERLAVQVSAIALLFSICVIYLLVFYYEQFSSIFFALIQFMLLMMILRYRQRFIFTQP